MQTAADFPAVMQVFEAIPNLEDDDIRVLLRSLGSEQVRRMLALGHGVLMLMDGHYMPRASQRATKLCSSPSKP